MDSFLDFKNADAELARLSEQLAEEKIPVQHATDGVAKVLGTKSAVKFLTHLRPGTEKHTSWDKVNHALTKQGVKTHHIAKIASHIKPAQYKEEAELGEEKDIVIRDKSGKVTKWSHEGDWHKSSSGTTTDKSGAKHTPYSKARNLARTALKKTLTKEDIEEAVKLGSQVKMHAPGKDYHDQVGHVGEIRHGAYKGAPKTYTVDYGDRKSVQLDKKNIKLHKEEAEQIDELQKSTLANYAKKSAAELPKHQANSTLKHTGPIANAHAGKHPKTGESPVQWDDRKVKNRGAGIARAVDKLAKESSDVCNVCGQTPCNCTHINEAGQAGDPLGHLTAAERAKELARRKAKIASNTTPANKKFVDNAIKNVKPRNEETETSGVHRVGVTVSDPNHQAVTQRKEKVQKFVRIKGGSHEEAVERAKKHFKGKGWKVHDAEHAGMVHEEVQIDELSNELLQRYKDKAKVSADELAAKGQHSKANDRYMKHMQASGKQIDRTMKNIHKAMQQRQNEDVELEEATQEELRAALNRHSERAIEANKRGDDAAVKMHQERMNKVKDKMAKLARNQ